MKCRKKGGNITIPFYQLSKGDTFLFDGELCMKTLEKECADGDQVVGVILSMGELLYRSDFDMDCEEVKKVYAECFY